MYEFTTMIIYGNEQKAEYYHGQRIFLYHFSNVLFFVLLSINEDVEVKTDIY